MLRSLIVLSLICSSAAYADSPAARRAPSFKLECLSAGDTKIVHDDIIRDKSTWRIMTSAQFHLWEGIYTTSPPVTDTVPGDGAVIMSGVDGAAVFWMQGERVCLGGMQISKRIAKLLSDVKDGPLVDGMEM